MKTIQEIKNELTTLQATKRSSLTDSQYSKLQKECELLRKCQIYLETNPNESYLKNEQNRIEKILQKIESSFGEWKRSIINLGETEQQLRAKYNGEMEKTKYSKQLKTLNYLLN